MGLTDNEIDCVLQNHFQIWPYWRIHIAKQILLCTVLENQLDCSCFEEFYTFCAESQANNPERYSQKLEALYDSHPAVKEPIIVWSFGGACDVFFYECNELDNALKESRKKNPKTVPVTRKLGKNIKRIYYRTNNEINAFILWIYFMNKYFSDEDKFNSENYNVKKLKLFYESLLT